MISSETVKHVAKLARLKVSDNEVNEYSKQLSRVLEHFESLKAVNTEGVEPLVTPNPASEYRRVDEVVPSKEANTWISHSPDKIGNLVKVPTVVG